MAGYTVKAGSGRVEPATQYHLSYGDDEAGLLEQKAGVMQVTDNRLSGLK